MPARARTDRNEATRTSILDAAERLFAEHGVHEVSNRQVAEAAGQGNTAVVGYHFGSKHDLVRAIVRRHSEDIERSREQMLARIEGSDDLRDWLACLVRPTFDHLGAPGTPTWYARFGAQVMSDPALRAIIVDEHLGSPGLMRILDGLHACLPSLPPAVFRERGDIARSLLVDVPAERERAVAEGTPTARATWADAATGLVDVLVGVWLAPVTATDQEHA
ncbi:TetR family transcriptional regulator [Actinomycetospora sp. NBRC 106375]|uniref:TetR family transcriptional regulator n=1 Tax=Actinomycetospora sp. NBRC 106375 TaxID=3032207 RepID=UPI0024A516D1|nr:TetR family transcriptional regulator [Actinomycetospora sp. NBRC 106375]GLZ49723.1 TetR family transcriptional regulator [Actinomycetospora sp. NBRC 106375]